MSEHTTPDQRTPLLTRTRDGVVAWVAAREWVTEPQPALSELLAEARETVWTCYPARVRIRVAWIHAVARCGRILPWSVLRFLLKSGRPLTGDLPPVQRILTESWASGDVRRRSFALAYWCASFVSRLADCAPRTGLALLFLFFALNAFNTVPPASWLIPDQVDPGWWLPGLAVSSQQIVQAAGAAALVAAGLVAVYRKVTDGPSPVDRKGADGA